MILDLIVQALACNHLFTETKVLKSVRPRKDRQEIEYINNLMAGLQAGIDWIVLRFKRIVHSVF